MDLLKEKLHKKHHTVSGFLQDLSQIFQNMDAEYDQVAGQYGFDCKGCKDNCCLTRFYHHTVLEYAYLKFGLNTINTPKKQNVIEKAAAVKQAHETADAHKEPARVMCPLNTNGLCDIYAYRPMICRLHGIPHELQSPDGRKKFGPGCDAFDRQCKTLPYVPFDRTSFYVKIVNLEQQFRQELGYAGKLKMTIAEIIVS